jgi:hypothetical protein
VTGSEPTHVDPGSLADELRAELDAVADRARSDWHARQAARAADRAERQRRRDHGLRARHAAKLGRNRIEATT